MKDLYFLKEFMLRIMRNNVFMNVRMCEWAEDKNELCSNCGLWPETKMHFFLSCPETKEIINFLEKILKNAGFLRNGNSIFPYFIYTNYKVKTIEKNYAYILPEIHL